MSETYTPKTDTERIALNLAMKFGGLYHTYGPGQVRRFYNVLERNPDGTFKVEPADDPAQKARP